MFTPVITPNPEAEAFVKKSFEAFKAALDAHAKHDKYMWKNVQQFPLDWEKVIRIRKDGVYVGTPTYQVGDNLRIKVHELADYVNFENGLDAENIEETGKKLGFGCAVLYNAATQDAYRVFGHTHVSDLSSLKFNAVRNSEPSVGCCDGLVPGWMSFRFYFASY